MKLPLIGVTVFRFEHESHDTWRGGRLEALRLKTNNDGEANQVDLADADGFPASLGNDAILEQTVLLNTVDGRSTAASLVDLAETGEDVLLALDANRYDALILDLGLPDMDGMAVLKTLRDRTPDLPVRARCPG